MEAVPGVANRRVRRTRAVWTPPRAVTAASTAQAEQIRARPRGLFEHGGVHAARGPAKPKASGALAARAAARLARQRRRRRRLGGAGRRRLVRPVALVEIGLEVLGAQRLLHLLQALVEAARLARLAACQ